MTRLIFSWLSPEAKAPSTAPAETKPAESSTIRVVIRRFLSWALEMGHGHNVFIQNKKHINMVNNFKYIVVFIVLQ
jgi:hypothetical protein